MLPGTYLEYTAQNFQDEVLLNPFMQMQAQLHNFFSSNTRLSIASIAGIM